MRFYSMGVVAENKALDAKDIEVTPIEELTMLDGELTSKVTDYSASAKDALGQAYTSTVKTNVSIKATWLPFGSANRVTAPDVRRGEVVMIFQFGDAPKYHWVTLMQDMDLRKLETAVWAFSATRNEADKTDADHAYYLEVSTHKKLVHFHTSKADGEPYAYDIQINAKDGSVVITDDAGNYIALDSANRRLEMKNVDGTHLDIDKKRMIITAVDDVEINTKKYVVNADTATLNAITNITKATSLETTLVVTAATTLNGGGAVSGGSGASFSVSGGLNADAATVSGALDISGGLNVGGFANFAGGHTR
jgi:phage baseplate assembly protein gpV